MNISMLRTRWAAVGAAVAITLGAGGLGIGYAISPAGSSTLVPITPCRLADTRPAPDNVGPRTTALGANETYTITAAGSNGNCTGGSAIPSSATGLALNVTAIGATAPTFLTLWPAGATQPTSSNLNPLPGQGPVPNSVTTGLSGDGKFSVYNKQGTVNVIIDVVGYYSSHTHSSADITDEPGMAFTNTAASNTNVVTTAEVVASVAIRPPADGYVHVQASGAWYSSNVGNQIQCQITDGTNTIDLTKNRMLDTDDAASSLANAFSVQQAFAVTPYSGPLSTGRAFNLVCQVVGGTETGTVRDITMTATFFTTSYEPIGLAPSPSDGDVVEPGTPDGTPGGVGGG